jgi:hypothetical protein
MQKALHDGHIEPFIEFSPNLALNTDYLESEVSMEGDRSL